nr:hypothetical protein P5629_08520 [Bacillus subtilis]
MSENDLYVEQFKAWRTEQELLLKQINYDIEVSQRKIDLNEKQKRLHLQRVNIGIQEFNNWAETSNRKDGKRLDGLENVVCDEGIPFDVVKDLHSKGCLLTGFVRRDNAPYTYSLEEALREVLYKSSWFYS